MLKKLKIRGFKTLSEAELEFGRVNLFIGGNGSGKTNILESIGLVAAGLGRSFSDSDISNKGIRITPSKLMKSSFKNQEILNTVNFEAAFSNDIIYNISLESNAQDPLLRVFSESACLDCSEDKSRKEIFGRSLRGAKASGRTLTHKLDLHRGIWDQIKFAFESHKSVVEVFEEFSRYIIYLPQTDLLRGRYVRSVNTLPIGVHGEGLSSAVTSFAKEFRYRYNSAAKRKNFKDPNWKIIKECAHMVLFPGWASSFGASRNGQKLSFGSHKVDEELISRDMAGTSMETIYIIDKFMEEKLNKLSAYDSSEGTLFLLFAAIILSHPDAPKIFALDNVDCALNPRLTRKLVEQIISVVNISTRNDSSIGARQVFLTSHNPTAMDAFDLFNEDQKIFVVSREQNGHTKICPLKPNPNVSREDWQAYMKSRNLSQAWLDGDIPDALGPELGEFI